MVVICGESWYFSCFLAFLVLFVNFLIMNGVNRNLKDLFNAVGGGEGQG